MSYRLRGDELARRGQALAVVGRGVELTYTELAMRAASVWRGIRRAGVLPGDRVALVSSGRGIDEVIGLVGIITCGGVVVPLDATSPPARLAAIATARGCRAIVCDEAASKISGAMDIGRVVLDGEGMVVRVDESPSPAFEPAHDLACILHTSGSTGTPKPVPITWEGLDAFTAWTIDLFGLAPADRVLRVAELIFDLAWFDHIATLRAGATLAVIGRRDLAAGRAFVDAASALSPSVIYGVPSLFMKATAALREGERFGARAIAFAGEVFPPRELAAFAQRAPKAALYNLFGPTETNVCTYHAVDRAELDGERELPIGIPTPYSRCALIDEDGRSIEGEGTGELIVEGPAALGGKHATRDRVERKAHGLFYFRGRMDRMVKIRGYRVEPGEVESALAGHPMVKQAAVIAKNDPRLGKSLAAFVEVEAEVSERDLRVFLAEKLPPYMIPDRVIGMSELPRTPTGKIDYRALV